MRYRWLAVLAPSVALGHGCEVALRRDLPQSGIQAVYLTWQRDPTTTMTVHWLTRGDHGDDALTWTPRGEESWQHLLGAHRPVPHSDRLVHTVELTELSPGDDYLFRIAGARREYAFRTMPADADEPITFVVGGDVYRAEFDRRIYDQAARRDPMFVLIGGDPRQHCVKVLRYFVPEIALTQFNRLSVLTLPELGESLRNLDLWDVDRESQGESSRESRESRRERNGERPAQRVSRHPRRFKGARGARRRGS